MKKIIIYIFSLCFFSQIFGQPGGKQLSVNVNVSFFDNKANDTIKFSTINKSNFIAKNKENEFKISFYFEKYIYESNEFIKKNKSSLDDVKLKRGKIFNFGYYTPIDEVENKIFPTKDIIIVFKKNRRKMIVFLKLYQTKNEIDLGKIINIPIVFDEGRFEVIDVENPKLIPLK
ncbi:hypothetical protein SL053_002516 [Flavobacterium psychrophilum]|nr:hypothetical protein [Flavobacterium psychrophilum]